MATPAEVRRALSNLLTQISNTFLDPRFEDNFETENDGETWKQRRTALLAALDGCVPLVTHTRTQAATMALRNGVGDGYTEQYLALLLLQYVQAYRHSTCGYRGGSINLCNLAMEELLITAPNVLSNVTTARNPSHYEAMVNLFTISPWQEQEKVVAILQMCADWLPKCDFEMS